MRQTLTLKSSLLTVLPALATISLLLPFFGCGGGTAVPPARAVSQVVEAETTGVQFLKDYKAARRLAREQGKPMLLFFSAPDCMYSARMLGSTFRDERILEMADRFVCVRIDASEEEELCKEFRIKGYPTIQFVSPQGVLLKRLAGSQSPDQLMTQMSGAIQIVTRTDQVVLQ